MNLKKKSTFVDNFCPATLFFMALKLKQHGTGTFCMSADFVNFWPFCKENSKLSFCLLLQNYLLSAKIVSVTLFIKLVSAF
jgi:hypothetical protein